MAGVFITATDTDAGKTIVTASLLRCLLHSCQRATPVPDAGTRR